FEGSGSGTDPFLCPPLRLAVRPHFRPARRGAPSGRKEHGGGGGLPPVGRSGRGPGFDSGRRSRRRPETGGSGRAGACGGSLTTGPVFPPFLLDMEGGEELAPRILGSGRRF